MQKIWNLEDIPRRWDLTTLKQIYKKGPKNCLQSYRYVHIKEWMLCLFDGLVFNKIRPKLIENMTKFQIGTKPGHRPQEHIFVLNSVLDLNKKKNSSLIIQTFDISQYFDKHVLKDAGQCLADAKVDGKCYRLFHKLNSNTVVQVKTPVGMTGMAETGENMAQGSKSAGMVCATSLSQGVDKYYEDSKHEIEYGDIKLSAMQYQDDALRMTASVEGAIDGSRRFEMMMKPRRLQVNISKSAYFLSGRKNVDKIREEIKTNPIL